MSRRSISTTPSPPQEADSTVQTIDALAALSVSLSRMQRQRQRIPHALRSDLAKAHRIARSLWKRMQDGTLLGSAGTARRDPRDIPEVACELEDLANAVWMIHCGVDINFESDRLGSALLHVSRELRRLSNRVDDRAPEAPARVMRTKKAVA